ncbi:hypothetical protein BDR05DRAFT_971478 [Suillus weaverae]|nr:hypothetical protein BDR05DRAFT_971478 [Suillus weaverae]
MFSSMGRWGIATVMFIVGRYVPIAWIISEIYVTLGMQSPQMCSITYRISGVSLILILLATEGLLFMRTLALWHNKKKIRRFLLASYMVTTISTVTCIAITFPLLNSTCVPTSTQSDLEAVTRLEHLIMGGLISTALFEFTVAAITIYHSMLLRSDDMYTLYTLASTLSKGSLLYALSLFAISIANIVTFSLPVRSFYVLYHVDASHILVDCSTVVIRFQGVLHGVVASRILFDLRDADQIKEDSFCLSDLQFAPNTISTAT